MGIERVVLPVALSVALVGSTISALAQAQNTQEVQERRSSDDHASTEISREDATRLAQEYSVTIEEVYKVDRELHQPVEETLRGLPITKVGDWDDFARTHPFSYENINAQNFPAFLTLYQQFIDQIAPIYWREVRQENVPAEERKPVISLLWGDDINSGEKNNSRGAASLVRFLNSEYDQKIKFIHLRESNRMTLYDGQITISNKTFFSTGFPSIIIYKISLEGGLRKEEEGGGVISINSLFQNRRVFKEYIQEQLLQ
ncbi:hypothetical protein HY483_01010 [Candidatus Woesearchaeota archaeon]|nr:hypothetical protein [Candidatus Woesearchaeota archaeon]